jgi:uncharacterized protein
MRLPFALLSALLRKTTRTAFAATLSVAAMLPISLGAATAHAAGNIVISQVYGGGGNTGATYKNDFIELFNRSAAPVNISGWSVQYASAANAFSQKTTLTGTIQPGQYFLVQQAIGLGGTVNLPTPEVIGTMAMSGTAGKVALVNNDIQLTCGTTAATCIGNAAVIDLVGYGSTASNFEGAGATPAPSNTLAVLRAGNGCTDADNNAADFAAAAPNPRNTASPLNACNVVVNAPVVASCPATVAALANAASATSISATDADHLVTSATITSAAVPGISLASVVPSTAINTALQASLSVNAAVGAYNITVQFSNDAAPAQTASCTIAINVTAPAASARIRDIQGANHISPLVGQAVTNVPGIVTGKRSNGFYMQDPLPDNDVATSEGIFVFTSTAPTAVNVGDAIRVSGNVAEFRAGGAAATNSSLTITQIAAPLIVVDSSGNALPDPILIGIGGRVPPNQIIESDASSGNVETSGTFKPTTDGLDFWESLEGMRIRIVNAVAVGPKNDFNEIPIIGDNGATATLRSVRGGIMATATDGNPERILIDDGIFPLIAIPAANVGDTLPEVIGIVDYSFNTYKLNVTQSPVVVPGTITPEVTQPQSVNQLAMAAYNVENLDPNDPAEKFATLAGQIVSNLKTPDVIGMTEIQDNNGATNDTVVDASVTLQTLANAISAAGGPAYSFRLINPVDDQDGGEPGGNIRVGFLYNPARVTFVDRAGGTATSATTVSNAGGVPLLSASPGRIDPTNAAFNSSRKPLVGEFLFNGRTVYAIVNHFNSKGGDNSLMGRYQPPVRSSEVQRTAQAAIVANFVQSITAIDPKANVVVLGDLNDYEYSPALTILKNAGLTDLIETLPPNERYTYVFEGNSQSLDHILVSANLMAKSAPQYDIVHINAEFAGQASDHDPEVVRLTLLPPGVDVSSSVQISRSGLVLNRATGVFSGTISIKNTSGATINGPINVLLQNLTAGVTLTNAAGSEGGVPYISGTGPIIPGATLTLPVTFMNPARVILNYDVRVVSGNF